MPQTNFPFGVNATTSQRTVAGEVYCNTLTVVSSQTVSGAVSVTGAITGAVGSVYGAKAAVYTVTLTSALSNATIVTPYTCYPEIVYLQDATANITRSIRVVGGVDSTGTASATLTVGSATSAANTFYTTTGGTVITQGSAITITSAVTATANTGYLAVNLIAVAS